MPQSVNVRPIVIQGLSVLILCAIIEILTGNIMEGMSEKLTVTLPGLILIIPPLLDLRGNVNGALASRLGTALHTGILEPKFSMTEELKINVASSLILSLIASATIGVIASLISLLFGISAINFITLILVAVAAGFISGVILAVLTVAVSIFSYIRGWDPDNITAPLMATIGDLITMVSIFIVVLAV
ncbi:MAG: magnesium transporter [Candidatus Hadarchaeum sp.]|uniref:magnesium transporter n=1 Tax=Candidatus Hadarchaeum sp. TaxID=2883567 RepID=UPI00316D4D5A